MATTKRSDTSTALRIPRADQSRQLAGQPVRAGDYLMPVFMEAENTDLIARFSEKFLPSGTRATSDVYQEFSALNQFLGRHVKPAGIRDVQCMLLWSEWVRTYKRMTAEFPSLIRENEFREVITETFGIDITSKGFRGEVYTGIKFIP